jgi:hypothetical protein
MCNFLLHNGKVAVTDVVVPKGCNVTRKCHQKLLRVGDWWLILLWIERIVVNRRDCLKPSYVRKAD